MSAGPVAQAVARLEGELAAFWSTPDTSGQTAVAKARASTMNFVVLGNQAELDRLRDQADALAETHAGRIFLVTVDGRLPPWEMNSDWSALCRREGDIAICYDRVELTFGAMAAERAASVVSALALSDVPVVVEVASAAPAVLSDRLAPACHRLIVDSAEIGMARIAELATKTRAILADRGLVRTFSWRELTARFFDDATTACRAIQRVEVVTSGGSRPDPAALFLGWLASRLGWTFESRSRARDASGAAIDIAVTEQPASGAGNGRRQLDAVRITTRLGFKPLHLECARVDPSQNTVRWLRQGAIEDAHVHALGYRDETWVLTKAVDETHDGLFRGAVTSAASWIGQR